MPEETRNPVAPVGDHLRELTDAVTRLFREHIELAKTEMSSSARRAGKDAAFVGVGAWLLGVGYALLMFALGYGLGDRLGMARGFLIVAGVNVLVGFALVAVFGQRLRTKDKPSLDQTAVELQRDRALIDRAGHIIREQPH